MSSSRTPRKIHQLASYSRQHSTQAEAKLWAYLRAHRLGGVHFRRQHVIGNYIVDFCAPRKMLIIELDGSQHLDNEKHDKERTAFLSSKGYRVLRFWNNEAIENINGVIIIIEQALSEYVNDEMPPPASPIF
jgi:very-short-patch-repair endonuclease